MWRCRRSDPCASGDRLLLHRLQRIAELSPALVAVMQRTHAINAEIAQTQRSACAGGVAGDGAVENDVPVPWNAIAFCNQRIRLEEHSPGQPARVGKVVKRMAEVDNVHVLAP